MQHANAPLTPNGRLRMVELVVEEQEFTFEAAAAASNVAKSTVWDVGPALAPGERRGAPLAGLSAGSLVAAAHAARGCSPRASTTGSAQRRAADRLGAAVDRDEVGYPHSTVHATLGATAAHAGRGAARGGRPLRVACPGDLLHMDTKRFARFTTPGHAVTGDRTAARRRARVGYEFAHSMVDDHSRLAYSELHPDERAETVTAFSSGRSRSSPATASVRGGC